MSIIVAGMGILISWLTYGKGLISAEAWARRLSLGETLAQGLDGVEIGQLVELLDPAAVADDEERAYEYDRLQRTAIHLDLADRFGAELEAATLDDAAELLGARPATWQEADAQLEELVLASGPERDAEFIRFFHRRLVREESLLQPVLREQQDARFPPLR